MAIATAILFSFLTLLANKLIKIFKKLITKKLIEPQISFLLRFLSRVLNINCAELGPGQLNSLGFYSGQTNKQKISFIYID